MPSLLIADDSPGKIDMLRHYLKKAMWQGTILVAHTTEEAELLMKAHDDIGFGLIDFYMPSKNGPYVIRALKEKNPGARCALVSSSEQQENIDAAMKAGAEAFVCSTWDDERVEGAMMGLLKEWALA